MAGGPTRYNLTGTKGMPFSVKVKVNLKSGNIADASFPTRIFNRHDTTGAIVAAAVTTVDDPDENLIEMTVTDEEMDKLDPDKVYAYQIDGVAQDAYEEAIAHGRFYVNPRYSEGGGNAW